MAFVLDETGISTVQVDGTLYIQPTEAYLTVDLTNYHWEQGREFVLVECGTLSGTFDEAKITITGLNGGTIEQDTDNGRITLTVKGQTGQGTRVSFR